MTKKVLYIGIYKDGTTSQMRADVLKRILNDWEFHLIDTDIPFSDSNRIFRSISFRFKIGPLVSLINKYIIDHTKEGYYDLIWVDKAIFVYPKTTKFLKERTELLIHYTPDTAFYGNHSKWFDESLSFYDLLITTKSFELSHYHRKVNEKKVFLATQGFDGEVHRSNISFEQKINRIVFIGLCEPERKDIIQYLIENDFTIALGGYGWKKFVKRNLKSGRLIYLGKDVRNYKYSEAISSSYFGLGLLSKRFPELHTTRTFEIPACRTLLLTERNKELESFFNDQEVVFYLDKYELVEKLKAIGANHSLIYEMSENGYKKVVNKGYDNFSIIRNILVSKGVLIYGSY